MRNKPVRGVVLTFVAALAMFCVVQDNGTAAGARRYVRIQRDAVTARAPGNVTVEEIMTPAIRDGVRAGLASAAGVIVLGLSLTRWYARRP